MDENGSGQRAFDSEPPDLDEIRAWLDDADGVDARRVLLAAHGGTLVLGGSVASPEEADRAALIVERSGQPVVNRLQIDPALREGAQDPEPAERVEPADDEVLVGDTDMLAGPEAAITDDISRSLDDNEPLEAPEDALFPPTLAEARGARPAGPDVPVPDADELPGDERPAAADLSARDLRAAADGAPLPALDPELDATQDEADTAPADPTRGGSGGVQETGERRPEAEDDPAIRDEPPKDQ